MTWWKGSIGGVLVLGVVGITIAGLRHRPPPAVPVQIGKAQRGTITRTIVGAGKVQSVTTINISSNLSGDLIGLNVKEGDHVTQGEVLAQIDPRQYKATVRRVAASVNGAQAKVQEAQVQEGRTARELDRVKGLVAKGLDSAADLDTAKADHDVAAAQLAAAKESLAQAQAALDVADTDLSKTTLRAPMDGTVIELDHLLGERVRGSDFSEDTVMVLAALNDMEVKLEVGEHEVVWLRLGQKATITIDAIPGQTFTGRVTEIAQQATIKNEGTEQETVSFPIKVALDTRPPHVLPGMSAEVHISAETHHDAVYVPIQAVTVRSPSALAERAGHHHGHHGHNGHNGHNGHHAAATAVDPPPARHGPEKLVRVVFVVGKHNRVQAQKVKTGIAAEDSLEILQGLKAGERVVEGPYRTVARILKNGDIVRKGSPVGWKHHRG